MDAKCGEETKALETPWPTGARWGMGTRNGVLPHGRVELQPSGFTTTVKGDPVKPAEARTCR